MTLNPNSDDSGGDAGWRSDIIAIEGGDVVTAKPHTSGDSIGHHVEVKPYSLEESVTAAVAIGQLGDTQIPMEGSQVLVGYRRDTLPVVLGAEYGESDSIPEFEPGERRIGHPASSSHIQFNEDGSITVVGDGGATITLDGSGSISLNGGSTAPITDITTTTDADGHITSISTTRASNVTVPE